jgi:hypothetical protein
VQNDLVERDFTAAAANELWLMDITEHPTDWIPVIVATPVCQLGSSKPRRRSAGVSQPRLLRGRALSSAATCWSSSGVCLERSVPAPLDPGLGSALHTGCGPGSYVQCCTAAGFQPGNVSPAKNRNPSKDKQTSRLSRLAAAASGASA